MRFKDNPDPNMACAGVSGDKVMHASFRIGDTNLMASDGRCTGKPTFQGFSLSITVSNEAEADKLFNALANGGKVEAGAPHSKTQARGEGRETAFLHCWPDVTAE